MKEMFEEGTTPTIEITEIAERAPNQETNDLVVIAKELTVTTPEEAAFVGKFLIGVKSLQKKIHSWIDPTVNSAYDTWQKTLKNRKDLVGPTEDAEKIAKRKLSDFDMMEERKRQEAQAKLDADRRAKEDAERARLKAEADKVEAEARAKADKARAEAEALAERARKEAEKVQAKARAEGQAKAKIQALKDKAEADARALKKKAEDDARILKEQAAAKAEALKEQVAAVHIPQAVAEKATPKTDGVAITVNWKFEITDEKAVPRDYLMLNEQKIAAVGKATKGEITIPGIRFYADRTVGVTPGSKK